MNQTLRALALAAASAVVSSQSWAQTQPGDSYVGLVYWGKTQASSVCDNLTQAGSGVVYPVSTVTPSSSSTSCDDGLDQLIKVYAGNQVQGNWYIEGALISFGKASSNSQQVGDHDASALTPDVVTDSLKNSVSARAAAISVAYKYRFEQLDQRLTGVARLGLALMQTTYKSTSQTFSSASDSTLVSTGKTEDTGTKLRPIFGLGAEYRVSGNIHAVASADFSSTKVDGKSINLTAFGVGLQMGFDQ